MTTFDPWIVTNRELDPHRLRQHRSAFTVSNGYYLSANVDLNGNGNYGDPGEGPYSDGEEEGKFLGKGECINDIRQTMSILFGPITEAMKARR